MDGALSTERLTLEPLTVGHADEMAALLADPTLHRYIGGRPSTAAELRERYARLARGGSSDGTQRWLNWVARSRIAERAVGFVQATVTDDGSSAEIAWVIGVPHQGRGYATEAARAVVGRLRDQGVVRVIAHVHPEHVASAAVARAVGLVATDTVVEGEVRWQG